MCCCVVPYRSRLSDRLGRFDQRRFCSSALVSRFSLTQVECNFCRCGREQKGCRNHGMTSTTMHRVRTPPPNLHVACARACLFGGASLFFFSRSTTNGNNQRAPRAVSPFFSCHRWMPFLGTTTATPNNEQPRTAMIIFIMTSYTSRATSNSTVCPSVCKVSVSVCLCQCVCEIKPFPGSETSPKVSTRTRTPLKFGTKFAPPRSFVFPNTPHSSHKMSTKMRKNMLASRNCACACWVMDGLMDRWIV